MTFDEAVKARASDEQYERYLRGIEGQIKPLHERRDLARQCTGQDIAFDWEIPRTPLGQYMWQWTPQAVIDRCLLAAPLGDLTWSRQGKPYHTSLLVQPS
jgi:isocitrate lyase